MNKYDIKKLISYGTYSKVYLVKDKFNNNFIMKKLFNHDDNEFKNCELINNFNDINLLKYYEKTDDVIIYEFFNGEIFSNYFIKLSVKEFVIFLKSLVNTLINLENNGYYHFDIKEENILINKNKKFKLIDYGFLSKYTKNIKSIGSYGYLPPEYYKYDMIIPDKFDIFSLGIIIFKYFLNFNPFGKNKNYNLECWCWCKKNICKRDDCLLNYLNNKLNQNSNDKNINIIKDIIFNTISFDYKKRWDFKKLSKYLDNLITLNKVI